MAARTFLLLTTLSGWLFLSQSVSANPAQPNPAIVAHRGASGEAPENTAASLQLAVEQKADFIELDVHNTKDGVIVLQHDTTLEKYTGKKTRLDSLSYEEAARIDVGSWFDPKFKEERMIPLEDALRLCAKGKTPVFLERKTGSAAQILAAIRKAGAEKQVVVIAFDWDFMTELRKLAPEIPIGPLGKKDLAAQLDKLAPLKPEWIGWKAADLDEKSIAEAQKRGIKVNVWTVDKLKDVDRFAKWGVDAITTNFPARSRATLAGE